VFVTGRADSGQQRPRHRQIPRRSGLAAGRCKAGYNLICQILQKQSSEGDAEHRLRQQRSHPFAKTGLADVCGTLPVDLHRAGHNVAAIMPAYRQVKASGLPLEPLGVKFDIPIGNKIVRGRLLRGTLPGSDVPIFFVEQDDYYDRPELYRSRGEDYKDNCERFVFFCRAVLESIRLLHLQVDVVHCHDWQTALIPAYLQLNTATHGYEDVALVLTIHNLAYKASSGTGTCVNRLTGY
jgi:starch synthase